MDKNRQLLDFITELRKEQWNREGEVAGLRVYEKVDKRAYTGEES